MAKDVGWKMVAIVPKLSKNLFYMMVYESWLNKNRKVLWQGMKRQVVEGRAKQSEYRK